MLGVLALPLAAGLVIGALARPSPAGSGYGSLIGTVGPGFNISLRDASGKAVSQLAPGTYTIDVSDRSPEHNFHLFGPGVDQATSIDATGSATWTVTFQNGRYNFICDAHPGQMRGSFRAGSAPRATLAVSKLSVRVGRRVLVVRLTVNRSGKARFKLLRRSKSVRAATFALHRGANSLRFRLPKHHAAGTYRLSIVVRAAGLQRTFVRSVRLARA